MESQYPALARHFKGHKSGITCLSFNPSAKQLASSSLDHFIMIWNIGSVTSSIRYIARKASMTHVDFSPNGDFMATSQGPYVRLWIPAVHGKSSEFKAHITTTRSVQFSPDGANLVTASDDKCIKLWSTTKFKFISSFTGHTNWVKIAKFSRDGSTIMSASDDKTVRLWDPNSGKLIHMFNELKGIPRSVDFHPSGHKIAVGMSHNVVKLYDLREMKLQQYYQCHEQGVNAVAFHPNGHYLITGSDDATTKVIDLIEERPVFTVEGHRKAVTAVAFSKLGKYFATASEDKEVLVWESNLADDHVVHDPDSRRSLQDSTLLETPTITAGTSSMGTNDSEIQEEYSVTDYQDKENCDPQQVSERSTSTQDSGCKTQAIYEQALNSKDQNVSGNGNSTSNMNPEHLVSLVQSVLSENEQLRGTLALLEERISKLENLAESNK